MQSNPNFRSVLHTSTYSQLVAMSLLPGEDIGEEVHRVDQFIYVTHGEGKAILDGAESQLMSGVAVCIPAGARHNIVNTSAIERLQLFTLYSPAEHAHGVIHPTKAEAERQEAH